MINRSSVLQFEDSGTCTPRLPSLGTLVYNYNARWSEHHSITPLHNQLWLYLHRMKSVMFRVDEPDHKPRR